MTNLTRSTSHKLFGLAKSPSLLLALLMLRLEAKVEERQMDLPREASR